jgi:replication factor C small subunit
MAEIQLWTEKYRPQKLDEVIGQAHVVARLRAWVKEGSIPNMLFAGPAGIGKTTVALCLAHEIFGKHWHENFQETNASDERGIDVVRGRIKDFAQIKPFGSDFKIIFLDESDSLTPEAQQALRRTMERYSNVCRFILSCNYSSKIIEPIQSRTAVFRFKPLSEEQVVEYLERLVKGEKLDADKDGLKAVYEVSEGDLRKATNILQAASALGKIKKETVFDVSSQAKPDDVKNMLNSAIQGRFPDAKKMLYEMLYHQGLSGQDIIKAIHREIFGLQIPEEAKIELIEKTGEFEFRVNQGGSEDIQLEALLAQFLKAKK